MAAIITHKQGDSLEWAITLTESGVPVNITSWSIRAQIRNNDTLISALTVTVTDASAGEFSLTATPVQTDTWTAGTHTCDIEFTDNASNVFSTETFTVILQEDISHD